MKKPVVWIIVVGAFIAGIMVFTPVGEVCIGMGYFVCAMVDYGRQSTAAEKRVADFSDADYVALVNKVERLMSEYHPSGDPAADRVAAYNGMPVPDSLAYLRPQRVWISADSAQIELLHMMDSDTTLYVERSKEGKWSVSGHFGDYMNKTRTLWKEPEPNERPDGSPVKSPPSNPRALK